MPGLMRRLAFFSSRSVRADRGEHGAVAILVAGGMVALLVVTAMLLDFGLVRMDRQQNKSAADAAATAGAIALTSDRISLAAVCAAKDFLILNNRELSGMTLSGGQSTPTAGPDCSASALTTAANQPCDQSGAGTQRYDVVYTAPNYRVQITTPYILPSQANPGSESYSSLNDDRNPTDGCDQVRVSIQRTRTPGLGSLATSSDLVTQVASVARGIDNPDELLASVAVLLERTDCAMSVSGNGGQFYITYTSDKKQPGFLHSDSDGSACQQTVLKGQQTSPPGIEVEDTPDGITPYYGGIIQTRARAITKAVDGITKVVAQDTTAANSLGKPRLGPLVGRAKVDSRYRTAVIDAMNAGVTAWNTESLVPITARYDVCAGNNSGGVNNTGLGNGDTALLYCGTWGATHSTAQWKLQGKQIKVNYSNIIIDAGSISISGQGPTRGWLWFPNAETVYMTGTAGGGISVNNDGTFEVGSPYNPALQPTGTLNAAQTEQLQKDLKDACDTRPATHRVKFVLGNGDLNSASGSLINMCHTTLMTLGGVWGGGSTPPGCVPNPTTSYVWPNPGTCASRMNLSGKTYWTAPNEKSGVLADPTYWAKLEDLAYWNESTDVSAQGAQTVQSANALLTMSGLFFTPNSDVDFGGNSNMTFTNAQFIARRMTLSGSAKVTLTPNEYEMVLIPASTAAELMR